MSRAKLFILLALLLLIALGVWSYSIYRSFSEDETPAGVSKKGDRPQEEGLAEEAEEGLEADEPAEPSLPRATQEPSSPSAQETQPTEGATENSLKPGFELLQKKDLPEAEEFFIEHIKIYPLDPDGHFGLGSVYRLEEEFEQSIDELSLTLLLKPGHLQAKQQLAEMLAFQMKQDFGSAEKLYEEILEEAPEDKSAVNGLATVYLSTGRVDPAITLWEDLKSELPDPTSQEVISKNLSNAYYVKAKQETEAGNADQAEQWMAKALELNPNVAEEGREEKPE